MTDTETSFQSFSGTVEAKTSDLMILRQCDTNQLFCLPLDTSGTDATRALLALPIVYEVEAVPSEEDDPAERKTENCWDETLLEKVMRNLRCGERYAQLVIANGQIYLNGTRCFDSTTPISLEKDVVYFSVKGTKENPFQPLLHVVACQNNALTKKGTLRKTKSKDIRNLIESGYIKVGDKVVTDCYTIVNVNTDNVRIIEKREECSCTNLRDAVLRNYEQVRYLERADYLIEQGRVSVNGNVVIKPDSIFNLDSDTLEVDHIGRAMMDNPSTFRYYDNLVSPEKSRVGIRKIHLLKEVCDQLHCYAHEAEKIISAGGVYLNGTVNKDPLTVVESGKSDVRIAYMHGGMTDDGQLIGL